MMQRGESFDDSWLVSESADTSSLVEDSVDESPLAEESVLELFSTGSSETDGRAANILDNKLGKKVAKQLDEVRGDVRSTLKAGQSLRGALPALYTENHHQHVDKRAQEKRVGVGDQVNQRRRPGIVPTVRTTQKKEKSTARGYQRRQAQYDDVSEVGPSSTAAVVTAPVIIPQKAQVQMISKQRQERMQERRTQIENNAQRAVRNEEMVKERKANAAPPLRMSLECDHRVPGGRMQDREIMLMNNAKAAVRMEKEFIKKREQAAIDRVEKIKRKERAAVERAQMIKKKKELAAKKKELAAIERAEAIKRRGQAAMDRVQLRERKFLGIRLRKGRREEVSANKDYCTANGDDSTYASDESSDPGVFDTLLIGAVDVLDPRAFMDDVLDELECLCQNH